MLLRDILELTSGSAHVILTCFRTLSAPIHVGKDGSHVHISCHPTVWKPTFRPPKRKVGKTFAVGLLMTKGTIKLCLLSLFLWDMYLGISVRGYSWIGGMGNPLPLCFFPSLSSGTQEMHTVPVHSEDGIYISLPMVSYFFGVFETYLNELIRVQELVLAISNVHPAVHWMERSKISNNISRQVADQILGQEGIFWRTWPSCWIKTKI